MEARSAHAGQSSVTWTELEQMIYEDEEGQDEPGHPEAQDSWGDDSSADEMCTEDQDEVERVVFSGVNKNSHAYSKGPIPFKSRPKSGPSGASTSRSSRDLTRPLSGDISNHPTRQEGSAAPVHKRPSSAVPQRHTHSDGICPSSSSSYTSAAPTHHSGTCPNRPHSAHPTPGLAAAATASEPDGERQPRAQSPSVRPAAVQSPSRKARPASAHPTSREPRTGVSAHEHSSGGSGGGFKARVRPASAHPMSRDSRPGSGAAGGSLRGVVRPDRIASARSTQSAGTSTSGKDVEWKRWLPLTNAPPRVSAIAPTFDIKPATIPDAPPKMATADNLTRATKLVVKLTKDYNTLCRDAAKKEAQLETLQSTLRELQELRAGSGVVSAEQLRVAKKLEALEADTTYQLAQGQIYEFMAARVKDDILLDQAATSDLREEVALAAKVQEKMSMKASNLRDKHNQAEEQLQYQRNKLELYQGEWAEGLGTLKEQSEEERSQYLQYHQWARNLEHVGNAMAMQAVIELHHKVDESNLRSMGLSEIKRGSRNAAKKIQAAYDELLHVTNTNDFEGLLNFFSEKQRMAEKLEELQHKGEERIRQQHAQVKALEDELKVAKFTAQEAEEHTAMVVGNASFIAEHQEKLKEGERQEEEAVARARQTDTLLVSLTNGVTALHAKVLRLQELDPRFTEVLHALPGTRQLQLEQQLQATEGLPSTAGRLVPSKVDGDQSKGDDQRLELVSLVKDLERAMHQIAVVVDNDKREWERERERAVLEAEHAANPLANSSGRLLSPVPSTSSAPSPPKMGTLVATGGPASPARPVTPEQHAGLGVEEASALANSLEANLRVDPAGDELEWRLAELRDWFGTNRGLIRHIFLTKGTPKGGYVNMRWLAALCGVLKLETNESELGELFASDLTNLASEGVAPKWRLHVKHLLRSELEEEPEAHGVQAPTEDGEKAAVSRLQIKERERMVSRKSVDKLKGGTIHFNDPRPVQQPSERTNKKSTKASPKSKPLQPEGRERNSSLPVQPNAPEVSTSRPPSADRVKFQTEGSRNDKQIKESKLGGAKHGISGRLVSTEPRVLTHK